MEHATSSMSFIVDNVQYDPAPAEVNPNAWIAEPKGEAKEHTFPDSRFNKYHEMCLDYIPEE